MLKETELPATSLRCHRIYLWYLSGLLWPTEKIVVCRWCQGCLVFLPPSKGLAQHQLLCSWSQSELFICCFLQDERRVVVCFLWFDWILDNELLDCSTFWKYGTFQDVHFVVLKEKCTMWPLCFEDQTIREFLVFSFSSFILITFPIPASSEIIASTQWPTAYSTKLHDRSLCEGQLYFLVLACTCHGLLYC